MKASRRDDLTIPLDFNKRKGYHDLSIEPDAHKRAREAFKRRKEEGGLCLRCPRQREAKGNLCTACRMVRNEQAKAKYYVNLERNRTTSRESAARRRQDPLIRAEINRRNRDRYKGNRELFMRHELKRYGITLEQYRELEIKQNSVCALCLKPPMVGKRARGKEKQPPRLCVDHDHKTGKVRGLLCHWCNSHIIAGIEKSGATLQQIADYLAGGVPSRSI